MIYAPCASKTRLRHCIVLALTATRRLIDRIPHLRTRSAFLKNRERKKERSARLSSPYKRLIPDRKPEQQQQPKYLFGIVYTRIASLIKIIKSLMEIFTSPATMSPREFRALVASFFRGAR